MIDRCQAWWLLVLDRDSFIGREEQHRLPQPLVVAIRHPLFGPTRTDDGRYKTNTPTTVSFWGSNSIHNLFMIVENDWTWCCQLWPPIWWPCPKYHISIWGHIASSPPKAIIQVASLKSWGGARWEKVGCWTANNPKSWESSWACLQSEGPVSQILCRENTWGAPGPPIPVRCAYAKCSA